MSSLSDAVHKSFRITPSPPPRDTVEVSAVRGLTKVDILQFYRSYLAPHSPNRRKLSCHVVSTLKAAGAGGEVTEVTPSLSSTEPNAAEGKEGVLNRPSSPHAILDLTEFKSCLPLLPLAQSAVHLDTLRRIDSAMNSHSVL